MADQSSNLTDSVPKIVITEPSPFPVTSTSLLQNVLKSGEDKVPTTTAPVPEPVVSNPKVSEDDIGESVSVSCSDTVDSCSVSVEQKIREVVMEVEEAGLLTLPEHEVAADDDDFTNVHVHEGAYDSFCRWMDSFSESKFMLPILIVLLAMPISAGFMGARYMDKCPLSTATPLFLFMMGVLGTVVILCRMACILRKMAGGGNQQKMLGTVIAFGNLAMLLLLCTEMTSFLRVSPNFEPGTPNYCHRIFYNFTYWLNWTSLFVTVFLVVVHAPKCSRQTSQAEAAA